MRNTYAAWVKEGKTYDYEDSRTTYRLQTALNVLKSAGVEPTVTHSDWRVWDWATNRERHECDWRCKTEWPEWVTDEMFDEAVSLACSVHTERGRWNRSH